MSNMFLRHLQKMHKIIVILNIKNQLKVKILNGQFAGETTTINHQYVKSQADSEAFRTHEKYYYIFLTSRVMLIL